MANISVIIPCYNSEKYIKKCLDALVNQTYKDFDVIIVDDGSTDKTEKTIKDYIASNKICIEYIKNESNFGPGFSRNKGIALSSSRYIAFCDSDDWYENDYLELMAEKACQNNSDMVFCNSQKILASGKRIKINNIGTLNDHSSKNEILAFAPDSLCAMMVRRKIISDIKQPNIKNGEDMAIIPVMIMKSNTFSFIDKSIYNYFCRSGSLSLSANPDIVSSLEISFSYILDKKVEGFEQEIEFLGIKNFIYGALLNSFKLKNDKIYGQNIINKFEKKFPKWFSNKYIKGLPIYKRVFLKLVKLKCWNGIRLMSMIHKKIVG